ncbi:MAG: hypothetical protein HC915_02895 [Anaerolineae bacterium]|nr:hypothetical protein [Anaerolineae bacterium]
MITLRGITWDHPRGYAPLEALAPIYAARYGVQLTWERRSLKSFGATPLDALAAEYDVLVMDHPHVGMAVARQCLLPLDSLLDAALLETLASQSAGPSHASYHYAGQQWALALDAATHTSAWRPDLTTPPRFTRLGCHPGLCRATARCGAGHGHDAGAHQCSL